jgi:hypothetical protein
MSTDQSSTRSTRRNFLRRAAATATAGVGTATVAAAPATADHDVALPEHVTLSYPSQSEMERFVPLLDMPSSASFRPDWYAWKAASPEHKRDVYVYVASYLGQRGYTSADSHRGDREIALVFVDPDLDEVSSDGGTSPALIYTAWHWQVERTQEPNIYETDNGQHVTLETYSAHHQFRLNDEPGGVLYSVSPMGTSDDAPFRPDETSDVQFEKWLAGANGTTPWEQALHPGALQNPWQMERRQSYWREGEESVARMLWDFRLQLAQLGFGGLAGAASESDLVDN